MALAITGWKLRAKEAKCGSIWAHFSKFTIHQFISQLSMGGEGDCLCTCLGGGGDGTLKVK